MRQRLHAQLDGTACSMNRQACPAAARPARRHRCGSPHQLARPGREVNRPQCWPEHLLRNCDAAQFEVNVLAFAVPIEANPTALLAENAGCLAINGTQCIKGLTPAKLREHVSVKLGPVNEVRCPQDYHREAAQTCPRLPMTVAEQVPPTAPASGTRWRTIASRHRPGSE
jgi:hypothetical protein